MNNRISEIDIAKGIGILCVVLGHCNLFAMKFVYLFHMALFFIISGFFIKEKHIESIHTLINFIKKRFILIGGTFILCNGIFLLLHNFFININIYTADPLLLESPDGENYRLAHYFSKKEMIIKMFFTFILARREQIAGPTWFLQVLLIASIVFIIFYYLKKYIKINENLYFGILLSGAFILSYILQLINVNVYGIGSICLGFAFLCIGYLLKSNSLLNFEKYSIRYVYIFLLSFLLLIFFRFQNLNIQISTNEYGNIFYLIIASVAGFYFVYSISKYLVQYKIPNKIFSYLGQHTLVILCLHFLVFKLISYIEILVYNYPSYMLAEHPIIWNHHNKWCILFVLCGLYIPCAFSMLCFKIKEKLIKN